jgi:hypothetical protein
VGLALVVVTQKGDRYLSKQTSILIFAYPCYSLLIEETGTVVLKIIHTVERGLYWSITRIGRHLPKPSPLRTRVTRKKAKPNSNPAPNLQSPGEWTPIQKHDAREKVYEFLSLKNAGKSNEWPPLQNCP